MPKLRHSVTSRYYDPDDDDRPKSRKKKSDPLRDIGIIAVIAFIFYLLYLANGGH